MVMEHTLLNLYFFFLKKKKNLRSYPKLRVPARYEGKSSAKLFLSEEASVSLPTKVMDRVARS